MKVSKLILLMTILSCLAGVSKINAQTKSVEPEECYGNTMVNLGGGYVKYHQYIRDYGTFISLGYGYCDHNFRLFKDSYKIDNSNRRKTVCTFTGKAPNNTIYYDYELEIQF